MSRSEFCIRNSSRFDSWCQIAFKTTNFHLDPQRTVEHIDNFVHLALSCCFKRIVSRQIHNIFNVD